MNKEAVRIVINVRILEIDDYTSWFLALTDKEQAQVMKRLNHIKQYDHFGDAKSLGEDLCELRWKKWLGSIFCTSAEHKSLIGRWA